MWSTGGDRITEAAGRESLTPLCSCYQRIDPVELNCCFSPWQLFLYVLAPRMRFFPGGCCYFLGVPHLFVARDASFDYRVTHHHCFCARWLSPVKRLMALQDELEGTRLLLEELDYRLTTGLKRAEHSEEAGASPADQVS